MSKLDIPTDPHQRAVWAQGQLRSKHSSFAAIARQHGWSRRAVAMAMRVPSYPQEQAIADAIGVPIESLFSERYDGTGNRLHPVRTAKDSRSTLSGNDKDPAGA